MPGKYFLTTPLYYVNSRPHIGHSYTEIAADTLARFYRLKYGREGVYFLTGTDEHGQKIDKAAQAAGLSPQEFTDKISDTFRDLWKTLNVEYDDFIRTTEPRHVKAVQAVWKELEKRGRLYKAKYTGWYCTPDETFWTEGQIFHQDGQILCPDCKRPVERLEEENYFLKMSDKQKWLIETIRVADKLVVLPETRRNEVLGFLENNELQDLCISRPKNRLAWGIPSPLSETHVTYVWFDALINYVSAVGYGSDEAKLKKWWPADVHLIGKDILRHHAVYWPILLEALGLDLPKMIFAHGWWVQGGEKMSKSRGNVVDPVEIVKTYGIDAYRYFLLAETPFGSDGTFSEEALILKYNTDLANNLGNLLNRTLTMCEKYFSGIVPQGENSNAIELIKKEAFDLLAKARTLKSVIESHLGRLAFSEALHEIWLVVDKANRFIESSAPWTLAKEKKDDELKLVIWVLAETIWNVAVVVAPFLPETSKKILEQLGTKLPLNFKFSEDKFEIATHTSGLSIQKGTPLFPRIESEEEKAKKLASPKPKKG